ncbi:uncharacterized protein BP01DRAFT_59241 [Aspergillus saccharolyticus JOP 1030-1]|uniref:Uncharacterized protein n=1 Tax=Aspergillus saccharolyticus JOP 1030-1 TaxID=1450539 RepID=A0A318ZBN5_9EURO|nr:hypothetical protein BP01DRAFT_59241 [Aspergillus saccharolyticus JOP 1030-1]PYH44881.1 hypothetical protein BP01DRAFT_59241 [Aspergillus saccharolyticus JOP 1030-1]
MCADSVIKKNFEKEGPPPALLANQQLSYHPNGYLSKCPPTSRCAGQSVFYSRAGFPYPIKPKLMPGLLHWPEMPETWPVSVISEPFPLRSTPRWRY